MDEKRKKAIEKWTVLKRMFEPDSAGAYGLAVTLRTDDILEIKKYIEDEKERTAREYHHFFDFLDLFPTLCDLGSVADEK